MLKIASLLLLASLSVGCPKQTNDDGKKSPTEQTDALVADAVCEADGDCELFGLSIDSTSPGYCCDVCESIAANTKWIDTAESACTKHRDANKTECPDLRCSETNLVAKCVDKTCKAVEATVEKPKGEFPEKDLSCKTDDDCTISSVGWKGDYCCSQCGDSAYSKAWLAQVKEVCDAAMNDKDYHQRCPRLSCTQSPEKVAKCVEGSCTADLKDAK